MINPAAALVALLLADTALVALVGPHGVKAVPPGFGDDAPTLPPRCVLLQAMPAGAPGAVQAVIGTQFMARCHGPTAVDAWTVYRAVWDVFYDANGMAKPPRLVVNRWFLRSATLAQPMSDVEPEGWPVVAAPLVTRWDAHQGATG